MPRRRKPKSPSFRDKPTHGLPNVWKSIPCDCQESLTPKPHTYSRSHTSVSPTVLAESQLPFLAPTAHGSFPSRLFQGGSRLSCELPPICETIAPVYTLQTVLVELAYRENDFKNGPRHRLSYTVLIWNRWHLRAVLLRRRDWNNLRLSSSIAWEERVYDGCSGW